jgi:hypothetical protein|mmetsp:Transcript_10009/g.16903  ORF Transcript_10009/g.16903 Transcript_10009/m.16903 type:complete len:237 (+) Transcript_10009:139-849(+)
MQTLQPIASTPTQRVATAAAGPQGRHAPPDPRTGPPGPSGPVRDRVHSSVTAVLCTSAPRSVAQLRRPADRRVDGWGPCPQRKPSQPRRWGRILPKPPQSAHRWQGARFSGAAPQDCSLPLPTHLLTHPDAHLLVIRNPRPVLHSLHQSSRAPSQPHGLSVAHSEACPRQHVGGRQRGPVLQVTRSCGAATPIAPTNSGLYTTGPTRGTCPAKQGSPKAVSRNRGPPARNRTEPCG